MTLKQLWRDIERQRLESEVERERLRRESGERFLSAVFGALFGAAVARGAVTEFKKARGDTDAKALEAARIRDWEASG